MVLTEPNPDRPVDAKVRSLWIRLAENEDEVLWSQSLRYRIFYEEMSAQPTPEMAKAKRDFDSFDDFCDHLLVFDEGRDYGPEAVVGTYRVMRREGAARRGQFYSVDEYDISPILAHPGEILELGRSCVDANYRMGATMQLLWRGIAEYVFHYDIDLMFGCASLPGTDPEALRLPLAYLKENYLAPPALRAVALPERYVAMDRGPLGDAEVEAGKQALPPLIKGYLRLGGFVGDGAVVDPQFGTTDVSIVVKTDLVTSKYYRHFARDEAAKGAAEHGKSGKDGRSAGPDVGN